VPSNVIHLAKDFSRAWNTFSSDSSYESGKLNHGGATEEGRRTGFPLLRYGCQLQKSALEHSSIWRNKNVPGIDIERAKYIVFIYVVVPLMNYMSTKFKGAQNIFVIFF
jgi:hypothetical protein